MRPLSMTLCAATGFELACADGLLPDALRHVTGVGIPAVFGNPPPVESTLLLNIGIAGAYPGTGVGIGDIVLATDEVYGDIGFELSEPPYFQPITQSPFGAFYDTPFPATRLAVLPFLPTGRGCTVSTCTGTEVVGLRRRDQFEATFETMEGAALAQIAQQRGIPFVEIRAISNIASTRDMHPENIKLALANLRAFLAQALTAVPPSTP